MASVAPESRAELVGEIDRLRLDIALADEPTHLGQSFRLGPRRVPNRLCALPLLGEDATAQGAPSASTIRRYQRLARNGFGIIWFEATLLDPDVHSPGWLCMRDPALDGFARCVDAVREESPDALLILQLWPSPGWGPEAYAAAARRAARAGFDGVDIACCHGNPLSTRLADRAAGDLAERSLRLRRTVQAVRAACPALVVAVRLDAYHARTDGFGVDAADYRRTDLREPVQLAQWLGEDGVNMLSVTGHSPNLFGMPSTRAQSPIADGAAPHEHSLTVLARHQAMGRALREAAPGMVMVGCGYSGFGPVALALGEGAIRSGAIDVAGIGRLAFCVAADRSGPVLLPGPCSLLPFAEADVWEDGGPFGRRPARDAGYRDERFAVFDRLRALDPAGGDLEAAFQQGQLDEAFRIIRAANPLPELTAHIRTDTWTSDRDVARQLRYMIAWTVRDRGGTGVRVPDRATGRRIAVIGGGPTGLAATVRLLECGHAVALYEREDRLGGAPALIYPEDRSPDPAAEIIALLAPALAGGRLTVALNHAASADQLKADHDAVLIAIGCWGEPALGKAEGVWPALQFLKAARCGVPPDIPPRVAILCGGDAAMDAAVTARRLGAERVELLFDCAREAAHWHLPDAWFESDGAYAHFETCPVGYRTDAAGAVRGLDLSETETMDADLVIEAMELFAETEGPGGGNVFLAGGVVNGGASVEHCIQDGLVAAGAITQFLGNLDPAT